MRRNRLSRYDLYSRTGAWAILPATKCLFEKNKVTVQELTTVWDSGTVVVCRKDNGQLHFIAGASGSYAPIGTVKTVFHDQTGNEIGQWTVLNELSFKLDKDSGKVEITYAVPPVMGENMVEKAGVHVFK
jgi:hypothetical protein